MTATEATAKGYKLVQASPFEYGLIKNGKGVRTWFQNQFGREIPDLEHPLVQAAIDIQERFGMPDIPKVKPYPPDAIQCDDCGGLGCPTCQDKGWVPPDHPRARKCLRMGCLNKIPPDQVAIYCSHDCAFKDA